jgi:hypothetical protein
MGSTDITIEFMVATSGEDIYCTAKVRKQRHAEKQIAIELTIAFYSETEAR